MMGTNFYWHDRPCRCCNRYETIHVGKRSAGWSFSFRAWPREQSSADPSQWGYGPESPFEFPVMSRGDWHKVFVTRPGRLVTEYGEVIDDPVAWLDGLQPPDVKQQAWEDRQYGTWLGSRGEYRDAKGFHFSACEFF